MLGREFAINDLAIYEDLIYNAIKEELNYYSVAMSYKYLGHFTEALNRLFFNQKVITEVEYDVINDYLTKVLTSDCFNNAYDRMKVRDKDER